MPEEVQTDFQALPGNATEQQKEQLRKKYCSIAGEILGLDKYVGAYAKDCAAKGEDMEYLLDVVNEQHGQAASSVSKFCE